MIFTKIFKNKHKENMSEDEALEKTSYFKITTSRIALLGTLLALLITLKYVFGFILGIEFISFMFIFLGIFLPFLDLLLLVVCFNLLILAVYGFGGWWLVYWIIWPADAFISKVISKFTKNKFVFGIWGFIAGMSVFFWYFLSDWIFFGQSYALLNVISAIPVNTIEGFTTMIACITIAPLMEKVINTYYYNFWGRSPFWFFRKTKHKISNIIFTTIICLIAITTIILMFYYNNFFLELKDNISREHFLHKGHIK